MLRFNKKKLEVDSLDDKTMLNALMQGIRAEGLLMAELDRNTQKVTLPQFMKLTEEFINQEELIGTLLKAQTLEEQAKQEGKKASTALKLKEKKNPRKGEKKPGPLSFKSEPRKTEAPRFQQEVFTPLNASFTEVFMAIKGDPAFRWPSKMRLDPYK